MRNINEIIIHCTATRADWWKTRTTKEKVREIKRWHVESNGWSDIGYHFLIDRDGKVAQGRNLERPGAHTRGHNANSIGISLFGGYESTENDKFADNFTPEQDAALRELIATLKERFSVDKVSGHNEYAAKACPGFKVGPWLAKKPVRTAMGSTTLQGAVAGGVSTVTGAATAVSQLDGNVQLVVAISSVIALLAFAYMFRERLNKWAKGVR